MVNPVLLEKFKGSKEFLTRLIDEIGEEVAYKFTVDAVSYESHSCGIILPKYVFGHESTESDRDLIVSASNVLAMKILQDREDYESICGLSALRSSLDTGESVPLLQYVEQECEESGVLAVNAKLVEQFGESSKAFFEEFTRRVPKELCNRVYFERESGMEESYGSLNVPGRVYVYNGSCLECTITSSAYVKATGLALKAIGLSSDNINPVDSLCTTRIDEDSKLLVKCSGSRNAVSAFNSAANLM